MRKTEQLRKALMRVANDKDGLKGDISKDTLNKLLQTLKEAKYAYHPESDDMFYDL